MEQTRRNPLIWLALGALVLALIVAPRLVSAPRGPACVELSAAQPGFSGLSSRVNPACIRIRLR